MAIIYINYRLMQHFYNELSLVPNPFRTVTVYVRFKEDPVFKKFKYWKNLVSRKNVFIYLLCRFLVLSMSFYYSFQQPVLIFMGL